MAVPLAVSTGWENTMVTWVALPFLTEPTDLIDRAWACISVAASRQVNTKTPRCFKVGIRIQYNLQLRIFRDARFGFAPTAFPHIVTSTLIPPDQCEAPGLRQDDPLVRR